MTKDTHGQQGEGWVGFDLDGTLAKYDKWEGIDHIGEPIKPMVELIKRMHDEGKVVKIMTARVAPHPNPEIAKTRYPLYAGKDVGDVPMYAARWKEKMRNAGCLADWIDACNFYSKEMWTACDFIADWCLENLGFVPEIVYQKDPLMLELYDDRCKQVEPNTGVVIEEKARYFEEVTVSLTAKIAYLSASQHLYLKALQLARRRSLWPDLLMFACGAYVGAQLLYCAPTVVELVKGWWQ